MVRGEASQAQYHLATGTGEGLRAARAWRRIALWDTSVIARRAAQADMDMVLVIRLMLEAA